MLWLNGKLSFKIAWLDVLSIIMKTKVIIIDSFLWFWTCLFSYYNEFIWFLKINSFNYLYSQIYHLFLLATLCYASISAFKSNEVQKVILVIALGHLSYLHLLRVFYDYGRYTIDITGYELSFVIIIIIIKVLRFWQTI